LCTRKYAEDCHRALGRFLDHAPDSVDSDPADDQAASTWTNGKLAAFGEPLEQLAKRFRPASRSLASLIKD
jgi:ferric-dicitrate binding protein FerR (iron transport regulator)